MSIIVQGGKPVFSKELNKYVDKDELDEKNEAEIEANLSKTNIDLSITPTHINNSESEKESTPTNSESIKTNSPLNNVFVNTSNLNQSIDEEEDDLPF